MIVRKSFDSDLLDKKRGECIQEITILQTNNTPNHDSLASKGIPTDCPQPPFMLQDIAI